MRYSSKATQIHKSLMLLNWTLIYASLYQHIIGSDNVRYQTMIWTHVCLLLVKLKGKQRTYFDEIVFEKQKFDSMKCIRKRLLQNGSHFVSAIMFQQALGQQCVLDVCKMLRWLEDSMSHVKIAVMTFLAGNCFPEINCTGTNLRGGENCIGNPSS